jgi:hypothetical protein
MGTRVPAALPERRSNSHRGLKPLTDQMVRTPSATAWSGALVGRLMRGASLRATLAGASLRGFSGRELFGERVCLFRH